MHTWLEWKNECQLANGILKNKAKPKPGSQQTQFEISRAEIFSGK